MGKPHPIELRERVVAFVDEGHGHREATRHFRFEPSRVCRRLICLSYAAMSDLSRAA
jgi:hypothetical protein